MLTFHWTLIFPCVFQCRSVASREHNHIITHQKPKIRGTSGLPYICSIDGCLNGTLLHPRLACLTIIKLTDCRGRLAPNEICWNVIFLFHNFCFKNKIINSSCVQSAAIISGQEWITLNDAKLVVSTQPKQYVFVAGTYIAISDTVWQTGWKLLPPPPPPPLRLEEFSASSASRVSSV